MSRFPIAALYLSGKEGAALAVGITHLLIARVNTEALREMVRRGR